MSNEKATSNEPDAPEVSKLRTILWLGVGLLVYIGIQWVLPKVGVSS